MRNVVEGISDRLRDNSLKPKWPTVCFCVRKKLPNHREKCLLECWTAPLGGCCTSADSDKHISINFLHKIRKTFPRIVTASMHSLLRIPWRGPLTTCLSCFACVHVPLLAPDMSVL